METFSITDSSRTEYDVGEIFREYGQEYELNHALNSEQRIALRGLASCRTSALGGHLERCSNCGFERPVLQLMPQPQLSEMSGLKANEVA